MTHQQKKLMILGAGHFQLPAIRRAVDLGYYVITLDYLPENVGHRHSHHYVNCSTSDKHGVLEAARQLDVQGIMTVCSDVAVPTVGFVAETLHLPGVSAMTAHIMANKHLFRARQHRHGLTAPRFVAGQTLQDIMPHLDPFRPPLMFKPTDTSGSRGVSRADNLDPHTLERAFVYAQNASRSKTVCVEEFRHGIEVGGDAFLLNAELAFCAVTHKHKKGFVPTGHSLPANICLEDQERVRLELLANCHAADYTDGPLNFDVLVSPQSVMVVEMSPRLGGNGIHHVVKRGTGVDLLDASLRFTMGEKITFPADPPVPRKCGSWVFASDRDGVLESIASQEQLRTAVPEVLHYVVKYRIGESVPKFVHGGNGIGHVVFDCDSSDYHQTVERISRALRLHLSPVPDPSNLQAKT